MLHQKGFHPIFQEDPTLRLENEHNSLEVILIIGINREDLVLSMKA